MRRRLQRFSGLIDEEFRAKKKADRVRRLVLSWVLRQQNGNGTQEAHARREKAQK
jgi:hypothetical protein